MASFSFSHREHDSSLNILLVALVAGLALPALFTPFQQWSTLLLQAIFFLSSLKIDLHNVTHEARAWPTILLVNLFMLIVLPMLVFLAATFSIPALALPLLLLAAMPAGMTSPLFAQVLGLNISLSLVITVTTSLLAPLTVPIVLSLLVGGAEGVNLNHLFLTLLQVTFIPLVLAQLTRRFVPGLVSRTGRWFKYCSVSLLGLLIASIAGRYSDELLSRFSLESFLGLLAMTLFFLLTHLAGYWLAWWRNTEDRLTITLSITYMNFTLAIFLAQKFFINPDVIFYTLLSILPWNVGIILFRRVVEHRTYAAEPTPLR